MRVHRPDVPVRRWVVTARQRTGVRKVEPIDGGLIAWLYPGGADLDDVLLQLATEPGADEPWVAIRHHRGHGPDPEIPAASYGEDPGAWDDYWRFCPAVVRTFDEEWATSLPGPTEVHVAYYRKVPWCHCGEGHSWHYEYAGDGPRRGAALAVVVGGDW